MKLSRDEEAFLRRWIYDEARFDQAPGPAKRLQVEHRGVPAELAVLIAAAIPDPAEQEAIACGATPPDPSSWPWTENELRRRVAEARSALSGARQHSGRPET